MAMTLVTPTLSFGQMYNFCRTGRTLLTMILGHLYVAWFKQVNQLPLQLLASEKRVKKTFIKCNSGNSKGLKWDALLKILLAEKWRHKEHWIKHIKNTVCFYKRRNISQMFTL